jgi:hypothetical protein
MTANNLDSLAAYDAGECCMMRERMWLRKLRVAVSLPQYGPMSLLGPGTQSMTNDRLVAWSIMLANNHPLGENRTMIEPQARTMAQ